MFNLLGIGNSFSDDAFEWIEYILNGMGIENKSVNNMYIGGCSLKQHLDNFITDSPAYEYRRYKYGVTSGNMKLKESLQLEDWQYVTLQQASHDSGIKESYDVLGEVIEWVKKYKPDAKLYWHMTWAYAQENAHPEFKRYDNDQLTMYNAIIDCVKSEVLKHNEFVNVIPSGTAIQNARTSSLGDSLDRDGYHLSYDLGRYIAGLCVVCTILDVEPEKIAFAPHGIDPYRRRIAVESVKNALKNPFAITRSKL